MASGYLRTICVLGTLAVALAAANPVSSAPSFLAGHIAADVNGDDLSAGTWRYILEVNWNTGSVLSLSHLNLVIDLPGGTCVCSDLVDDIVFASPGGVSNGTPGGCTVEYDTFLNCNGDPSIPGVHGILLKWEPDESHGCEPGPTGSGIFTFFSNHPPAPISSDQYLIVIKAGPGSLEGPITGYFPAVPCEPVTSEAATWTHIKQRYVP